MKFQQLLQNSEGMLDWDIILSLKNGETITCVSSKKLRWMLTVHDDFIMLEKLQLNDKGYLDPIKEYTIPIHSINYMWR